MDNPEKKYNCWKLGTVAGLSLLMTVLFYRETALPAEPGIDPPASKAAPDFLVVKVGDFRATIEWNHKQQQEVNLSK